MKMFFIVKDVLKPESFWHKIEYQKIVFNGASCVFQNQISKILVIAFFLYLYVTVTTYSMLDAEIGWNYLAPLKIVHFWSQIKYHLLLIKENIFFGQFLRVKGIPVPKLTYSR